MGGLKKRTALKPLNPKKPKGIKETKALLRKNQHYQELKRKGMNPPRTQMFGGNVNKGPKTPKGVKKPEMGVKKVSPALGVCRKKKSPKANPITLGPS